MGADAEPTIPNDVKNELTRKAVALNKIPGLMETNVLDVPLATVTGTKEHTDARRLGMEITEKNPIAIPHIDYPKKAKKSDGQKH